MTGKRRFYLDTSAYLYLLLDEEEASSLREELAGGIVLSSTLLVIEARRNVVRLARERTLGVDHYRLAMERVAQDVERFVLRDLALDLCEAHPLPAVATPRSADLIHLHTAMWFHLQEPLDRFVTFDATQRDAAREIGLPVVGRT